MRVSFLALALLCSACGPQDETNQPGVQDPIIPSLPMCTQLTEEEATEAQRALPPAGRAAGWVINADNRLVCSEPGPDGVTGCELAPGGAAVVARPGAIFGYRNETTATLSITITTDEVTCGALAVPDSPGSRSPA